MLSILNPTSLECNFGFKPGTWSFFILKFYMQGSRSFSSGLAFQFSNDFFGNCCFHGRRASFDLEVVFPELELQFVHYFQPVEVSWIMSFPQLWYPCFPWNRIAFWNVKLFSLPLHRSCPALFRFFLMWMIIFALSLIYFN